MASMLGIAIGVMALIVVLSVMNGFQKELRARILGVASHVQITGADNMLADWRGGAEVDAEEPRVGVAKSAAQEPRVVASAPFVNAQGMLTAGQAVRGSVVRGIVPDLEDKVA